MTVDVKTIQYQNELLFNRFIDKIKEITNNTFNTESIDFNNIKFSTNEIEKLFNKSSATIKKTGVVKKLSSKKSNILDNESKDESNIIVTNNEENIENKETKKPRIIKKTGVVKKLSSISKTKSKDESNNIVQNNEETTNKPRIIKKTVTIKKTGTIKKLNSNRKNKSLDSTINKNDFELFIEQCDKEGFEYFKHKNKYNWVGPAVLSNNVDGPTIQHILDSINIEVNKEYIGDECIVYPKAVEDSNNIEYKKISLEFEEYSDDEIIATEWNYQGDTYLCDDNTGYLYDNNSYCIGRRVIKNKRYMIDYEDIDC